MKKYYAGHNPYGVNVSYESMGWVFFAFDSKKERDEFVDEHEWDGYPNRTWEVTPRADVESVTGRFETIRVADCPYEWYRTDADYLQDLEICVPRKYFGHLYVG